MTENDIDNEKSDEAEAGVNSRKRGYSFPRHFGEIFLSVICTAALFAMYVIWLKGQQEIKPGSFAASALSVFLFTSIGTVFIFRWFDDFRRCGEHVRKPEPKLLCDAASAYRNDGTVNFQAVKVFFTLVLVDVAVIVFIAVFRYILGYHDSFFDGLKIWRMLDSQHYLYIAEHWYTAEGNYGDIVKIVFLPGYPVLVAAVRFIVRDYLAAGLIVCRYLLCRRREPFSIF